MKKLKKILFIVSLAIIFLLAACSFLSSPISKDSQNNGTNQSQTYNISNDYFVYIGFKPQVEVSANLIDGTQEEVPLITIMAKCNYSLLEVSVNAKLYDKDNYLLDSFTKSISENINAETEFSLSSTVSASVQAKTFSVVASFTGKSTQKPDTSIINFVVTFVNNNSTSNITKTVKNGQTVSKPTNPSKTNYLFDMWCTDSSLTKEYDFSKAVTSNITLYAKYKVDYALLTNKITSNIMKCNVTVFTKSYNTFLGFTTSSSEKSGSGIIFYESSNDYYFLITNNHVIVKDPSYDKVSYTIEDYKGENYTGYLKHAETNYDLAVLYFKKGSNNLGVISRASSNPKEETEVISIGQPKGQSNAISYGKVLCYLPGPKLSDCQPYESNVSFNVLRHNANTASGSSGGAILNVDLKLVGIHYSGATDASGNFVHGNAIPIDKVNEFLTKYIWGK